MTSAKNLDGILLVDKPLGWTSFDVVAKTRSLLRQAGLSSLKVGHTGTLDPLATGLLVLLIGSYTKKSNFLAKLDKAYLASLALGSTSTTGDDEGSKTFVSSKKPQTKEILAILEHFQGDLQQTPPAYSALKIDGQRAYRLARKGQAVKLESRPIKIYNLKLDGYKYPRLDLSAKVSSGTYIRTLAEDIGATLGTGAYLAALRRTEVGQFDINDAQPIKILTPDNILSHIIKHKS